MIDTLKLYLQKNAPWLTTVGAVGGFVSDVLAPLANFALYLLIASLGGLLATGAYYTFAKSDDHISKKEKMMTRLVFFGIFAAIWALFTLVHFIAPPNGVLASTVPAIEDLQESLGIIEQDVAEIKQTTADIKVDTEQILAELRDLKGDLVAAQAGTISANPDSPEAWYTNAVLYAAQGDDEKAIEAYQAFFAYGYPYIDAYQSFNIIAKNELSKNALRSFYEELAESQPSNVLAQLMVGALMEDARDRRAHYDGVRTAYGDSSALLYWMINEYSVVGTYVYANEQSADDKQEWSTGDQATLKELVAAFEALPPQDLLEPYFISAFAYDGAKTLINTFANQFEDETLSAMLDNPAVLVVNPTGNPNESQMTFVIYDSYSDILWRIPGVVDTFTSTIPDAPTSNSPWGSTTSPELTATVSITPGAYDVELYWIDANDAASATYQFTDVEFLSFDDWSARTDTPVWEYPDATAP